MTRRQRELLSFITAYQARNGGVSPSYDEMREAMGCAAKSSITTYIRSLEERRLLSHAPHRHRAIETGPRKAPLLAVAWADGKFASFAQFIPLQHRPSPADASPALSSKGAGDSHGELV